MWNISKTFVSAFFALLLASIVPRADGISGSITPQSGGTVDFAFDGGFGGAGNVNPLIAKDLFSGTNGTALSSHTMDIGTGWTQVDGAAALNGSGAFTTTAYTSSESVGVFSTGVSDGLYEMTMTPQGSGINNTAPGMVFRYVDNNNYLLLQLTAATTNAAQLYQKSGGTFTQLVQYPMTITGGTAYLVDVSLKGQVITVNINGSANEFTFTSPFNQAATKFGFRTGLTGSASNPVYSGMTLHQNAPSIIAWPIYARGPSNPILVTGTAGGWEETTLAAPQPFNGSPTDNNEPIIQYSGFSTTSNSWQTGVATNTSWSTSGWVKCPFNPLVNALDGTMLYFNGAYWLWAATNASLGTSIFAWKKNSQSICDGGAWTLQNGGLPVLVGGPGAFDAGGVFEQDQQIIGSGSTVAMYYMGKTSGGVRTVSLAASTDGVTWSKSGLNPLFTNAPFSPTNTTLGAIAVNPTEPAVQATQFLITDAQGDSKYTSRYSDQLYWDGAAYHRRAQALVPVAGNAWESVQVFDFNQILVGSTWFGFYAGAPNVGGVSPTSQIGVVTAPCTALCQ